MKFLSNFIAIMLLAGLSVTRATEYHLWVPDVDGSKSVNIKLQKSGLEASDLARHEKDAIKKQAAKCFKDIFGINDISHFKINGNNIIFEMRPEFLAAQTKKNRALLYVEKPAKTSCCTIS